MNSPPGRRQQTGAGPLVDRLRTVEAVQRLGAVEQIADPLAPYVAVDRAAPKHECWVTGHMVAGLDGTAAVGGRVGALSTTPDQGLFRRMRRIADVVMVGAQTVRAEGYGPVRLDEEATAARVEEGRPATPPVAIVSRSLDLDWSLPVFRDAPADGRTIVLTGASADPARRAAAERVATVLVAGEDSVDPAQALRALADLGHRVVLCEGGPRWLGELVAADRLDELCLSVSPMIGGDPLPVCVNPAGSAPAWFGLADALVEGDTLFLRYERRSASER